MSPTGHLAAGFIAKHFTPKTPVFVLLIAAYLIDLLYFVFLISGIDTADYSAWSHSLLMALVWSVLTFLSTLLITKKYRLGLILGIVVFSHWILDFIVWDNLPITFSKVNTAGLGFYPFIGFDPSDMAFDMSMIIATMLELTLLVFGLFVYFRVRKKLRMKK